jgi:hypothetical protein
LPTGFALFNKGEEEYVNRLLQKMRGLVTGQVNDKPVAGRIKC